MRIILGLLFTILATVSSAAGEVAWKVLRLEGKAPALTVVVEATIQPGWHLYSSVEVPEGPFPTSFEAEGALIGSPIGEEGLETEYDKGFKKDIPSFKGQGLFWVPLKLSGDLAKAKLTVTYQVCKDGVCIPPAPADLPLSGVQVSEATTSPKATLKPSSAGKATAPSSEAEQVKKAQEAGILPFILLAVTAGATALLTPCVFPMIPITVSFFSKRKAEGSGLKQALWYCAGIIGTFTGLGVLVSVIFGATGLNSLATDPWLNLFLGVLFVVLALSLFGVFEIGLPNKLVNKFDATGKTGWIAPVLMGLTFSLTSFTCTLPFVGAVLFSAAGGSYFWPALGMLAFSTTFCIPFFLLALFPSVISKLPRSGAWMVVIKAYMGFIELIAATKFFSNFEIGFSLGVLTREAMLALWFALLVGASLYLFGAIRLPKVEDAKIGWFRRGVGVATTILAIKVLLAFTGSKYGQLGQLEGFLPPSPYPGTNQEAKTGWKKLFGEDWNEALAKAKETGKPIFIDFTGLYCTNCRLVEQLVFTEPEIQKELGNFIPVSLYTDRIKDAKHKDADKKNSELQQRLVKTATLPTYAIVKPDGETVVASWPFVDSPQAFAEKLRAARQ